MGADRSGAELGGSTAHHPDLLTSCAYEDYLRGGGVSGRTTSPRVTELRRLHEDNHATTCGCRCRVCGAEDGDSPSCLQIIMFRMRLEQRGAPLSADGLAR